MDSPDFLNEISACVPALRRYARALTHDRDVADDLVQDCLERAIRKRAIWRPTCTVKAWLFQILLNLYRNDLQQNRRRPASTPMDAPTAEPQQQPEQFSRLALADTSKALQALPAEQREALLLVVLEGINYVEAAQILNIPIGTLMSRISRARTALREMTDYSVSRLRTTNGS